jgi:atypical dual specificity phosphatase
MLTGFKWILPGRLAGAARPGMLDDLDRDLTFLKRSKIERIVSLTRLPLVTLGSVSPAELGGFEFIHFPIPDMGIPTPRACERLCRGLVADLDQHPTLLHCQGGLGRTGMVAACCLVTLGVGPELALRYVRGINSNYAQTVTQELFIEHYGAWLERRARAS